MNAPRPSDAFWLHVTNDDDTTTNFTIDALDEKAAFYEAAYILGGCGDLYVSRCPVKGVLYRVGGEVVATGNQHVFEVLAS
jgi:hypothetical protein